MIRKLIGACVGLAMAGIAGTASAAVLNVSGGQLLGAQNVDIMGTLYDVTFEDGTCTSIFGGCDELSDFAFNDEASATSAAQALLDQVFIDLPEGNFDTDPELTTGCTDTDGCTVFIPWSISARLADVVFAHNAPGTDDAGCCGGVPDSLDLTGAASSTFGRFAPVAVVPLPPAALLFGAGLAGLTLLGWRRRQT